MFIFFFPFAFSTFIYLKRKEKEREISYPLIHSSVAWAGPCQSQKLDLCCPGRWQGSNCSSHCCFWGCMVAGSWGWGRARFKPTLMWVPWSLHQMLSPPVKCLVADFSPSFLQHSCVCFLPHPHPIASWPCYLYRLTISLLRFLNAWWQGPCIPLMFPFLSSLGVASYL